VSAILSLLTFFLIAEKESKKVFPPLFTQKAAGEKVSHGCNWKLESKWHPSASSGQCFGNFSHILETADFLFSATNIIKLFKKTSSH